MNRYMISRKYFLPLVMLLLVAALLLPAAPVLAAPVISVSPTTGSTGTVVTITGTVFDSYKGDNIYIFLDDIEIDPSPLVVGESGAFETQFIIPGNAEAGTHWIEARSETSSTSMLAKIFFVVEETLLELDIIEGAVGTTVNVNGRGFYSGRAVTVYYYNIIGEKVGSATASSGGEFNYQFDIPFSTAGKHRITAENAEGNKAEVKFEVTPNLSLNLAQAAPGDLLKARGYGFGYRTEVEISFGSNKVALAKTDDFGNFEVQFNIPDVTPGAYYVRTVDLQGNIDRANFTVIGGVTVSQSEGSVGEKLTVDGAGFEPGRTVTIDYDKLRVATKIADNNGEFSTAFDIPESSGGSHVITVSDGKTTKQFSFNVETQAPPAPAMLLPANNSETKARTQLDWQDVDDLSQPVTYSMQIASDANFAVNVLLKEGLEGSEYVLAEDEQLASVAEDSPYYWRTRATDSAGNVGEWSAPWSFYVKAPMVPELSLNTLADIDEDGRVTLNWADVPSLNSPVAYNLQVATDLAFKDIMLLKEHLTVSEYVVSEEDDLPDVDDDNPYYWRVKAIDSANNESAWSAPQTFSTKTSFSLPGWAKIVLIIAGVLVALCLAFILGRRTAFKDSDY